MSFEGGAHTWRPMIAAATSAALLALITPGPWVAAALDRLVPEASRVDSGVMVVAFDEQAAEAAFLEPIPHRVARNLLILADSAVRGGARAVVLVGFDGFSLTGGPLDRRGISESPALQSHGIAPLLDLSLNVRPGDLPVADQYRVDQLAGAFNGIGLPLVPDGTGVLRTIPQVAQVPSLQPGEIVRPDDRVRRGASLVYGLALRSIADELAGGVSPTEAELGPGRAPLEDGRLRIRWSSALDSADDASVIPAGRALGASGPVAEVMPPEAWTGKIVLIGTVDPTQTPYYDTPVGRLPELLIQANALNTLLTGEYLWPASPQVAVLAVILLAAAVAASWRRGAWWGVAVGAILAIGWVVLAAILARQGWLLDPLRPAIAALLAVLIIGASGLVRQLMQRRRLAKLFTEYVPPSVARDLIESGRATTAQAGERLLVTVLFCDLRGFTPTAARLAPGDVRALLDCYYETFSRIVFDYGGTVLQYTGDEIFAVFGAPLPRTDHADAALACAQRMHTDLPALNRALIAEGLPEITFGIGLHSGLVVAAHVGSTIRRQYAVIGNTVNVGSRLCGQAAEHQIVYSQELREQLSEPQGTAHTANVQLKGIAVPVNIYRITIDQNTLDVT